MLDTRIDHAWIYTGREVTDPHDPDADPNLGSVGLCEGRLVLGVDRDEPARRVIDARGLAVCPGFIDPAAAHELIRPPAAPTPSAKARGGYTTELVGAQGHSAFPLLGRMHDACRMHFEERGVDIRWRTTDQYLRHATRSRGVLNRGVLIGFHTLRGSVVGRRDTPASVVHDRRMQREVERAMRLGCFGLSTDSPDRAGLTPLADVVTAHRGVLSTRERLVRMAGRTAVCAIELESGDEDGPRRRISPLARAARRLAVAARPDAAPGAMARAIWQLTGQRAAALGLTDRGYLRDGYAADVVVFDPDEIADTSSPADPHAPPRGIRWVFINGQPVVVSRPGRDPIATDLMPGRLLKFTG